MFPPAAREPKGSASVACTHTSLLGKDDTIFCLLFTIQSLCRILLPSQQETHSFHPLGEGLRTKVSYNSLSNGRGRFSNVKSRKQMVKSSIAAVMQRSTTLKEEAVERNTNKRNPHQRKTCKNVCETTEELINQLNCTWSDFRVHRDTTVV